MLNIIRADLYRILRGKGFYITLILLIAFIALNTGAQGGVQLFTVSYTGENEANTITTAVNENVKIEKGIAPAVPTFTGTESMSNTDLYLYFLLPFIVFIAAADFSTYTAKNVLSNGMPRVKYYFSKLILSGIFCLCILILNILIPIIITAIITSIIPNLNVNVDVNFVNLIKPFFAQLFLCISVMCVGIFFIFTTKKTAAVNGAYIAFCFLPLMIMFILYQINNKLQFLFNYDVISNIRMFAEINTAASGDIIRAFAIGAFYMLASIIGGILIFRKSEIK